MQVEHDAFGKIKRIVARDTLLTYSGFNEIFKIHTDASSFQLVSVVIHKGRVIAFYSRKLTSAQKWYSVTDIELLIIV